MSHVIGRRLARLALSVVVATTVLGGATPAVAAPTVTAVVTRPVPIVRDGIKYRLRLDATKFGREQSITVSITRVVDPDGRGPLRSRQTVEWTFDGLSSAITAAPDLSTATVTGGAQTAPYATVEYRFTAAKPAQSFCGGAERMASGRVEGSLVIRTKTTFGDITVGNVGAQVYSGTGCDDVPEAWPCWPDSRGVFAMRLRGDHFLMAERRGRAARARIFSAAFTALKVDDPDVVATRGRTVQTVVPADHVRISDDLRRGVIRGAMGTFTRGKATFVSNGPASTYEERCGARSDGTIQVMVSRPGRLSGTFRTLHVVGRPTRLADGPLRGVVTRTTVRKQ